MNKVLVLILIVIPSIFIESCSQSIVGNYIPCNQTTQEGKASLQRHLEIFGDGQFEYSIDGDTGPLMSSKGSWSKNGSQFQFVLHRSIPDSMRLIGDSKKTVGVRDNTRRIDLYFVRKDTLRMVGAFIIAAGDTLSLGVESPIVVSADVQTIMIKSLNEIVTYSFSPMDAENYYSLYLTGQRDQIADVGTLPFSILFLKDEKLVFESQCFEKVR